MTFSYFAKAANPAAAEAITRINPADRTEVARGAAPEVVVVSPPPPLLSVEGEGPGTVVKSATLTPQSIVHDPDDASVDLHLT